MKDYSNYFKGPSLNEAKRRSRDEVGRYDDAYHVPGDMVKVGLGKKYYIQTYGVKQMNVTVKLFQEYWKVCHINRLQKLKRLT